MPISLDNQLAAAMACSSACGLQVKWCLQLMSPSNPEFGLSLISGICVEVPEETTKSVNDWNLHYKNEAELYFKDINLTSCLPKVTFCIVTFYLLFWGLRNVVALLWTSVGICMELEAAQVPDCWCLSLVLVIRIISVVTCPFMPCDCDRIWLWGWENWVYFPLWDLSADCSFHQL